MQSSSEAMPVSGLSQTFRAASATVADWSSLPCELILDIAQCLPDEDICTLACVDRRSRQILADLPGSPSAHRALVTLMHQPQREILSRLPDLRTAMRYARKPIVLPFDPEMSLLSAVAEAVQGSKARIALYFTSDKSLIRAARFFVQEKAANMQLIQKKDVVRMPHSALNETFMECAFHTPVSRDRLIELEEAASYFQRRDGRVSNSIRAHREADLVIKILAGKVQARWTKDRWPDLATLDCFRWFTSPHEFMRFLVDLQQPR